MRPPLRMNLGNPVTEDDRFDRPELQRELLSTIQHAPGVAMFGLRRIGKSSLLRWVERELTGQQHTVLLIDAQGIQSLDQLMAELLDQIAAKATGVHRVLLETFNQGAGLPKRLLDAFAKGKGVTLKGSEGISDYWESFAGLLESAFDRHDKPVVLLIDELPFFCKRLLDKTPSEREAAIQLLVTLRTWRQKAKPIKMILTGSIGLRALLRQHGIDQYHLAGLSNFDTPPLGGPVAVGLLHTEAPDFVDALARGQKLQGWTPEHTTVLLEECGVWYPLALQHAVHQLVLAGLPDPHHMRAVFSEQVRAMLNETFLVQFDARWRVYKALDTVEQTALRNLLGATVKAAQPISDLALVKAIRTRLEGPQISELLETLREDGFVACRLNRDHERFWHPSSPLVPVWWQRSGLGRKR